MRFYFTYGAAGQPFTGGWTEVEAPTREAAYMAFRVYHPDRIEGIVNCADIYSESQFRQTEMYSSGNFGYRCHETITLWRKDGGET